MITLYDGGGLPQPVRLDADALAPEVIVVDLLRASAEEVSFVERVTGLRLPTPHRSSA